MPAIKVIDDPNISMWYYPESGIVHHQTHRFFHGKEWREALNKGAEIFEKYGARKWLSDERERAALTQEDREWSDTDWAPRMVKSGWKYWAIVQPANVIAQLSMQKVMDKRTAMGVTAKLFSSIDEAKKWLESCQ
jgi:hypothetical protein